MDQEGPGVVILVFAFHLLELLVEVCFAVVVDVISSCEGLPISRGGGVLLRAASGKKNQGDQTGQREYKTKKTHQIINGKEGRNIFGIRNWGLGMVNEEWGGRSEEGGKPAKQH